MPSNSWCQQYLNAEKSTEHKIWVLFGPVGDEKVEKLIETLSINKYMRSQSKLATKYLFTGLTFHPLVHLRMFDK